jgi:hypothetical protein
MLVPLAFGQNVGERIEPPDMKRFLQAHTLNLKKDFGGWTTETSSLSDLNQRHFQRWQS